MKIYVISYISYASIDNYLHSDNVVVVEDEVLARKFYEDWCMNAKGDCIGDEESPFKIDQNESCSNDGRSYWVRREIGTADELQVKIDLKVVDKTI